MTRFLSTVLCILFLVSAGRVAGSVQGNADAAKLKNPVTPTQESIAAGKKAYAKCASCHGVNGEGAFGPDLAGRGLNAAQVLRAVREPWGIMPSFVASQLSEKDAADLTAFFASLPKPNVPGPWRTEVPAGAPPGQATAINMGCGQCHGATLNGPRANMGLYGMDFDYFANLVYNHTTAMPRYRAVWPIQRCAPRWPPPGVRIIWTPPTSVAPRRHGRTIGRRPGPSSSPSRLPRTRGDWLASTPWAAPTRSISPAD